MFGLKLCPLREQLLPVFNCKDVMKDTNLDSLLSRSVRGKKQALIHVALAAESGW